MKTVLIVALILILPYRAFVQKKLAFKPTSVNFVIKNAGFNVQGSISGLEGFVTMDAQNADILKIEATVDANTILTGITTRDNHLKKTDYFNVKDYPKISITSIKLKKINNNKYSGKFNLTIKDVTRTIDVPFLFSLIDNVYVLKGEFSINRLDFKLGEESVILSDNVKIKIECKTTDK